MTIQISWPIIRSALSLSFMTSTRSIETCDIEASLIEMVWMHLRSLETTITLLVRETCV